MSDDAAGRAEAAGEGRRRALVTGISSGIGAAIARRLAADGWQLAGLSRRPPDAALAPGVDFAAVDLGDLDRLERWLTGRPAQLADLDAAVLCAGRGLLGGLEEQSYDDLRRLIDLDLTSQVWLAKAILPSMKQRGRGDLVLMGSEAALRGGARGAAYCAAKFGLRGFAQALRQECAPSGVRVSIVHPGVVRTPFFDRLEIEPAEGENQSLLADDVAEAVAGLLALRPGAVVEELSLSARRQTVVRNRSRRAAPTQASR